MEVKRQLDVLNRRLDGRRFLIGDDYTIADITIFPWYGTLVLGWANNVREFLSTQDYPHLNDGLVRSHSGQSFDVDAPCE
jgi:GSH-dependent disulfide-bond oxidoreductase